MHDGQKPRPLQEKATSFFWPLGVLALHDCEAAREHAASEVALELVLHESRQRRGEALFDGSVERSRIFAHDSAQRGALRPPPFVDIRPRGAGRCGRCRHPAHRARCVPGVAVLIAREIPLACGASGGKTAARQRRPPHARGRRGTPAQPRSTSQQSAISPCPRQCAGEGRPRPALFVTVALGDRCATSPTASPVARAGRLRPSTTLGGGRKRAAAEGCEHCLNDQACAWGNEVRDEAADHHLTPEPHTEATPTQSQATIAVVQPRLVERNRSALLPAGGAYVVAFVADCIAGACSDHGVNR
jgi:hypothetical protein